MPTEKPIDPLTEPVPHAGAALVPFTFHLKQNDNALYLLRRIATVEELIDTQLARIASTLRSDEALDPEKRGTPVTRAVSELRVWYTGAGSEAPVPDRWSVPKYAYEERRIAGWESAWKTAEKKHTNCTDPLVTQYAELVTLCDLSARAGELVDAWLRANVVGLGPETPVYHAVSTYGAYGWHVARKPERAILLPYVSDDR